MCDAKRLGFTLVEIAIVVLIIGLVAGGILLGRDLINTAMVRATVSQLTNYNTAVRTFQVKHNGLPGDLRATEAASMGFTPRSGSVGRGNGDGIIHSCNGNDSMAYFGCENALLWSDLSTAGLIDGTFAKAADSMIEIPIGTAGEYLPSARIGNNNVISVIHGAYSLPAGGDVFRRNAFAIAGINSTDVTGRFNASNNLTPLEAQQIDSKMDDGLPYSGRVQNAGGGGSGWIGLYSGVGSNSCVGDKLIDGAYAYNVSAAANTLRREVGNSGRCQLTKWIE